MFLTVLLSFVTSALICSAAPTLENDHCGKPGEKEGATLQGNWNAETYSPGTVAKFACVNGYIRDGPIRMACIEGSWLDISKGQCKILGYCSKPQQSHENGELEGQWNDETFPPGKVATYICRQGYSQTSPIKKACIEGEWITISKGQCIEDIVCNKEAVRNGIVQYTKETYKDGETVTLTCNEGYQIEHKPEEPRTCTAHGWSPPLNCISKKCPQPNPQNGYVKDRYNFPISPDSYYNSIYYYCNSGYLSKDRKDYYGRTTCTKTGWNPEPKCSKIGQTCGAPPVVQFGDITEIIQKTYQSGSSVVYKCANFYKLEGKQVITCKDGEWEKEPVCRVPCTVKETDLQQNNIQFKFKQEEDKNKKLYSEHADYMLFECRPGYQISDNNLLRIQCLDGVLKYPRCLKEEIGQTCGVPPVVQFGDITEIIKKTYQSGSSVVYKCANFYKLEGKQVITCKDGEWEKEPVCRVPCTVKETDMQQNNIQFQFKREEDKNKKLYSEHADYMLFECRPGYQISDKNLLRIQCLDGVLKYPRCLKEEEAAV